MFTVFLVDDDASVLRTLSRLLRAKGHEIRSFTPPREFLEQHDPAIPGCAVFDVSMPGLDGLALLHVTEYPTAHHIFDWSRRYFRRAFAP